ncbi:MAG: ATP phosphoribosyltransferase [candidate division Zixibacteria bacterium]|nr:ATP phosphoribosyltransferase [candidate division Zixibacteria bacterium]
MSQILRLVLPKGHLEQKVIGLLERIGMGFNFNSRSYRPTCGDPEIAAKMLKPQNIAALVALGRHDCGFTGHDWVVEENADVVELLDLGFDSVRIVVAGPEDPVTAANREERPLVIASEYERITARYIDRRKLNAVFIRTYGATEVLPPEDADLIVDNMSTGSTLHSHRLAIIEELMTSSTRFVANPQALADPWKKEKLDEMCMLMESTLRAEEKVLLEMNAPLECFERLIKDLPCMRAPTISPLYNGEGYAVKIAVPARDVPRLIPRLVAAGARDILEYRLEKIVV